MAAYNNMSYFQMIDCIIKNAQQIHIGIDHQVGNIAMNKYFTGIRTGNFICRYSTVTTSYP